VPVAIFAGKVAVVGAESPENLQKAIDQALS
jgi:predicted DsbA family dithiol-disulfide isomerase